MGFVRSLLLDTSGNAFVASVNYIARLISTLIFFALAAELSGYILAVLWFFLIHPIAWKIGDAFRKFTQPDAFFTSGAIDTFKQRIFWMIVPQLISTTIAAVPVLFIAAGFHGSKTAEEIANTPPMSLETDPQTGYLRFNVNKDKDFGSYAFLSAVKDNPFVLTGGVPVFIRVYQSPEISDTADPSVKKFKFERFSEVKESYMPISCVKEISKSNKEIYEKIQGLPGRDCAGGSCNYLIPTSAINIEDFKNKAFTSAACNGKIVDLPGKGKNISPTCVIKLDGMTENHSSGSMDPCQPQDDMIYTIQGRSIELEKMYANKLKQNEAANKVESSSQDHLSEDKQPFNTHVITESASTQPASAYLKINPSFDCSKAGNTAESLICTSNELATLDNQLSELYKTARANSNDQETLKSEQISWVKMSRKCADIQCLTLAYQMRISQLKN